MKTLLILAFTLVAINLHAQDTDSIYYINGLPVPLNDTANQSSPVGYSEANMEDIAAEQLPPRVVKALDKDKAYAGWQKATYQLDKNTGVYWVHIPHGAITRSYGFAANGHPVRYHEHENLADSLQTDR